MIDEKTLEGLFAEYANGILAEHHLTEKGWTFRFDHATRRLGCCDYGRKEIRFSVNYLSSDASQIRDTILHEVAHAIAGHSAGHGPLWKSIARHIGCTAERCATGNAGKVVSTKVRKFRLHCDTCGKDYFRERRSKHLHDLYCGKCKTHLKVYRRTNV